MTDDETFFIPSTSSLRVRISSPESMHASRSTSKHTVYFGYGSNLWQHQMRQRCPTSKYLGIARLQNYEWIIYDRGYANIVEVADAQRTKDDHDYRKEVWGLVYSLRPDDEKRLDGNEGVPVSYKKEWIECEFWAAESEEWQSTKGRPNPRKKPEKVDMLVYINRDMVKKSKPKEEYIYRMNCGIKDALKEGVPKKYIEQVLRKFIPDVKDEQLKEVAIKQALEFRDER